ncbi:MAG: OmpA family protein [Sneathiella sp.]|nr:OmpA family protein [Sneathiella sp.]
MTILSRNHGSLLIYLAVTTLLTACGTSKYEELQTTDATAGEFSKALKQEYSVFAKSEIAQYDWPDQHYIATKGLLAAKGAQPLPEDPKNWNIKRSDRREFVQPRDDLIHWLNTDARFKEPVRSAKAQASFDCWVEQKEENWQIKHINSCKQGMAFAMPIITQIKFAFDRSDITAASLERLRKVALDWRHNPGKFLAVQGHTDQVGSKLYNYALSKRRAEAVKMSLLAFGIPEEQIYTELWGKTRPRAELSDESHDQSNRRVEILKY